MAATTDRCWEQLLLLDRFVVGVCVVLSLFCLCGDTVRSVIIVRLSLLKYRCRCSCKWPHVTQFESESRAVVAMSRVPWPGKPYGLI